MKVLIAGFDLFGSMGGGQTFYRNLILRHPNIEFHYLRDQEEHGLKLPVNARAIDFAGRPYPEPFLANFDPRTPEWAVRSILFAEGIARSVAGDRYDLIDTPDYEAFGAFLRPALRRHGAAAERIALSMHGTVSTSLSLNWDGNGHKDHWRVELDRLQYEAADLRYCISEWYRDEWRGRSSLDAHFLDPMWFFDLPEPLPFRPTTERPVLRFIGRPEKRKGPHLFVNLLSWLPAGSYERAEIIGPDCPGMDDATPAEILQEMARQRGVDVRVLPSLDHQQLAIAYADRTVTFAPSIYDTLNLVALESLFAGCPTVVGDGAGVCRYLAERFPEVPFTTFQTAQFFDNVPAVSALLADYDGQRARLAEALRAVDVQPRGPGIADIYRSPAIFDSSARSMAESWYAAMFGAPPTEVILPVAARQCDNLAAAA